ncbi:MAG: heme exporter protein CcmD [Steroidobacteraceae bacterium]
MSDFLEMGGYARYLWPSYGLTFFVIALNIWLARRNYRNAVAELRRRVAMRAQA